MEKRQLVNFRAWLSEYIAGFYGDDEYVNANIKMKEDHSRRVCDEMMYLADEIGLAGNKRLIAETIALFHDVGRFEQFIKYRTYNDPRSINHCLLGVDILRENKILAGLEEYERQIIEKAIEYHGQKELPDGLDDDCMLFAKLIRDADKLDIYYVVTDYYEQYQKDPDNFKLEVELPNVPEYSHDILEDVLMRRRISYEKLKSWNDMKLCQLAWIYDVNFVAALKRIKERKFIEMIAGFLPQTDEIRMAKKTVLDYIDNHTNHNGIFAKN